MYENTTPCKNCGFVVFNKNPIEAAKEVCANCGMIVGEEPPPKSAQPAQPAQPRVLCPDGRCIGIIGNDGRCKECGKSLPAETSNETSVETSTAQDLPQNPPSPDSRFLGHYFVFRCHYIETEAEIRLVELICSSEKVFLAVFNKGNLVACKTWILTEEDVKYNRKPLEWNPASLPVGGSWVDCYTDIDGTRESFRRNVQGILETKRKSPIEPAKVSPSPELGKIIPNQNQNLFSWKSFIVAFVLAVFLNVFISEAAGVEPRKNIIWTVAWIHLSIQAWKFWRWKALLPYPLFIIVSVVAAEILQAELPIKDIENFPWAYLIMMGTLNFGGLIVFYVLLHNKAQYVQQGHDTPQASDAATQERMKFLWLFLLLIVGSIILAAMRAFNLNGFIPIVIVFTPFIYLVLKIWNIKKKEPEDSQAPKAQYAHQGHDTPQASDVATQESVFQRLSRVFSQVHVDSTFNKILLLGCAALIVAIYLIDNPQLNRQVATSSTQNEQGTQTTKLFDNTPDTGGLYPAVLIPFLIQE